MLIILILVSLTLVAFASAHAGDTAINGCDDYLAPLIPADAGTRRVEGSYFIYLHDGASMAQHLKAVGRNGLLSDEELHNDDYYVVEDVTTEYIDRIRREPRVKEVHEDRWLSMELLPDHETFSQEELDAWAEFTEQMLQDALAYVA